MILFQWDKNLETGLAAVDHQHRKLVDIVNRLGSLVADGKDIGSLDIDELFNDLVKYTLYHFQEEEKLMELAHVDSRHCGPHRREHQVFVEEVGLMYQGMTTSGVDNGRNLLEYLLNWLVSHIVGMDMAMARQIRMIGRGSDPLISFEAEEQREDRATSLLLNALKNLLEQVSSRNRQLMALNQTLERKVGERTCELTRVNNLLEQQAFTDELTGLPNRRRAMHLLNELWRKPTAEDRRLACMLIDADGFKEINDTFGHDAGDEVLRQLAWELSCSVRNDDYVCRLGGDEFLIICPDSTQEGILHIANLLRYRIANHSFASTWGEWRGSISVGAAVRTPAMQNVGDLIKAADLGVYAAKEAGRNCVRTATETDSPAQGESPVNPPRLSLLR